jgi:hypothetical protein
MLKSRVGGYLVSYTVGTLYMLAYLATHELRHGSQMHQALTG